MGMHRSRFRLKGVLCLTAHLGEVHVPWLAWKAAGKAEVRARANRGPRIWEGGKMTSADARQCHPLPNQRSSCHNLSVDIPATILLYVSVLRSFGTCPRVSLPA